ncbi:hypothetical protein SCB49_06542 [unidentified eubacterium SCB49]|nr:hypothetical protein SCB49_06542 [unidentified eubacterium SCB49]
MKNTVLLCLFCLTALGIKAQDPQMFEETWYLRNVFFDGSQTNTPLNENFNLTLTSNNGVFSFSANGVENELSGAVNFNGQTLQFQDVSATLLDCELANCDYETLYFYSVLSDNLSDRTFNYTVDFYNSGNAQLRIYNNTTGVRAYYTNKPLAVNTALFQTWYLYLMRSDLAPDTPVDPSLLRQVTINEDLTFTAIDNCAELWGAFEYYEEFVNGFYLQLLTIENDVSDCTPPSGGMLYFGDENTPLTAFLETEGETQRFYYDANPGFGWYYKNNLLSVEAIALEKIKVYPNPVKETLQISSSEMSLTSIEIVSLQGKVLATFTDALEQINLSHLSSGVYFIRLISGENSVVKKFIKK